MHSKSSEYKESFQPHGGFHQLKKHAFVHAVLMELQSLLSMDLLHLKLIKNHCFKISCISKLSFMCEHMYILFSLLSIDLSYLKLFKKSLVHTFSCLYTFSPSFVYIVLSFCEFILLKNIESILFQAEGLHEAVTFILSCAVHR